MRQEHFILKTAVKTYISDALVWPQGGKVKSHYVNQIYELVIYLNIFSSTKKRKKSALQLCTICIFWSAVLLWTGYWLQTFRWLRKSFLRKTLNDTNALNTRLPQSFASQFDSSVSFMGHTLLGLFTLLLQANESPFCDCSVSLHHNLDSTGRKDLMI